MRHLLLALLLSCPVFAQAGSGVVPEPENAKGMFYVDGIIYQYEAGPRYTVVAAARAVINRKFVAVKVRVYNSSQRSVTVKPEDVILEDAVGGRTVAAISGAELANRLRKPYNMARYTVNGVAGGEPEGPITSDMVSPQFLEMMRAMAARSHPGMAAGDGVLYTDTPGALQSDDEAARPVECDQICRLRRQETRSPDALAQLQRQVSPDYVERFALLANAIPPRGNVGGVLYCPLGKLAQGADGSGSGKKGRRVRLKVPVAGENFELELAVE
jgi:hypothetical protein